MVNKECIHGDNCIHRLLNKMMKKNNFKYYTRDDLIKEDKVSCEECSYADGESCTLAYAVNLQPEDCYWTFGGNIIGCKHGQKKGGD